MPTRRKGIGTRESALDGWANGYDTCPWAVEVHSYPLSVKIKRSPRLLTLSWRNIVNKKPGLRISTITGASVVALSMLAFSAQANLVTNGSFETTIGRLGNTTAVFPNPPNSGMLSTSANITGPTTTLLTLTGWSTFRDGIACVVLPPDTTLTQVCGPNNRFSGNKFWLSPGLSLDGGNYVFVDGDSTVTTALYQTVHGLTIGQSYHVSFWQAATQFTDQFGDTTEQWDVSLGGTIVDNTLNSAKIVGAEHHLSTKMFNASKSFVGWNHETLTFKATAASELLAFLALGTPDGLPPVVLLDGVSMTAVPEPGTLALVGVSLLGLLLARRQQKRCG